MSDTENIGEDHEFKCRSCGEVWDFDDLAEDEREEVTPPTAYLNPGESVKAKTMDDTWMYGEVALADQDAKAVGWAVTWTDEYDTLYEAWRAAGHRGEVNEDDGVVIVLPNGNGNNEYAFPESRVGADLTQISGVGENKEEALKENGFICLDDIRLSPQADLAGIEGIGNALAARIKADVGSDPVDGAVGHREKQFSSTYECPDCGHRRFWGSETGFAELGDCSHCGTLVVDEMDYIEEGDERYCSIDCLNKELEEKWNS